MKPGPAIDEVRRIRSVVSAECGNDPWRMMDYFRQVQARVGARLVDYGSGDRPRLANPRASARPTATPEPVET